MLMYNNIYIYDYTYKLGRKVKTYQMTCEIRIKQDQETELRVGKPEQSSNECKCISDFSKILNLKFGKSDFEIKKPEQLR